MREDEPQQKTGFCRKLMDLSNRSESPKKRKPRAENGHREFSPRDPYLERVLLLHLPASFHAMPDLSAIIVQWQEGLGSLIQVL